MTTATTSVTCGACEVDTAELDLTPSLLIALVGVADLGHEDVVKCLCPGTPEDLRGHNG